MKYTDNLQVPRGSVDVVLDTDAYNEIDDQFAISYLLRSKDKLNPKAIYAAPFLNSKSSSPKDGMEKSYNEILKILELEGSPELKSVVFSGSESFLKDETTPEYSPAAYDLVARAKKYSPEIPLYVVAIGAITNIASAILMDPSICENIVVVFLGGHSLDFNAEEFNIYQDPAASRVIFTCPAPIVQLPCLGVVSELIVSGPELDFWLTGKGPLAEYLAKNTIDAAEEYASGKPWTRVLWDVAAVAWLLNDNDRFMRWRIKPSHTPDKMFNYIDNVHGKPMTYVYHIWRDNIIEDLFKKLADN